MDVDDDEDSAMSAHAITSKHIRKDQFMKLNNAAIILDDTITTVRCHFNSASAEYIFLAKKDFANTLVRDDWVVADGSKGLSVIQVTSVDDESDIHMDSTLNYQWIFARVDMSILNQLKSEIDERVQSLKTMQRQKMREEVRLSIGVRLEDVNAVDEQTS
jgi:hypothetical protein